MTSLHKIYGKFLPKISDYKLLALSDEEVYETLFDYYETASALFFRCSKDLSVTYTTTIVEGVEVIEGHVVGDLTNYEIQIIVSLMLIEHITPQLLTSENLKQSLSDKDFKIYSQANQLREIRLLLESLERKAKKMITGYTYRVLEEGDKR